MSLFFIWDILSATGFCLAQTFLLSPRHAAISLDIDRKGLLWQCVILSTLLESRLSLMISLLLRN